MYFERNCKLTHQSPSINQSPVGSRMILWLMRLCVCIVSDKNNWQRIVLTSSQTDIYIHLDMKAIKTSEIRSVASPESNPPGCPPTTPLTPSITDIFILPAAWREVTSVPSPLSCFWFWDVSGQCQVTIQGVHWLYTLNTLYCPPPPPPTQQDH